MTATTTKTVKAANYSAEQAAVMVAEYLANPTQLTVEKIATALGRSVRSVVAKLARERDAEGKAIYKAKEYKTKAGEPSVSKNEHADAIGAVLKMSEPEIESLTKCNKTALVKIWNALANSVPLEFDAREAKSMSRVNGATVTKIYDQIGE